MASEIKSIFVLGRVSEFIAKFERQSAASKASFIPPAVRRKAPRQTNGPNKILTSNAAEIKIEMNSLTSAPQKSQKEETEEHKEVDNIYEILNFKDEQAYLDEIALEEQIGRGRFGIVYKCRYKQTDRMMAAKVIKCITRDNRAKAKEEAQIMNLLRHPKFVHLESVFETRREIVLISEYVSGGELFHRLIADDYVLCESECADFLRQICEGVNFMHRKNIVHLDLKPENIMCESPKGLTIKIIDFGLAHRLGPETTLQTLVGTPEFVSPEVIAFENITLKVDMWSVGVICYVLVSGLSPFLGEDDNQTLANVTLGQYTFEDEAFEKVSDQAKDFISKLLLKNACSRLSAEECLKHPWLSCNPNCRVESQSSTIPKERLKKFYYRRKFKKTANAVMAVGRLSFLTKRAIRS